VPALAPTNREARAEFGALPAQQVQLFLRRDQPTFWLTGDVGSQRGREQAQACCCVREFSGPISGRQRGTDHSPVGGAKVIRVDPSSARH
jgi:hypothetical protein